MTAAEGRGRSVSQAPPIQDRRNRSSTRGSRKRRRGITSENPMDNVSNYTASGWRRDLTHILSCYWAAQGGSLNSQEWLLGIQRFVKAMKNRKDKEWLDIKELTPLRFMPYVAELFRRITGRDLRGLGDCTDWIGIGGYYHWKLAQMGQLDACARLHGHPVPSGPVNRPSGRPHPRSVTQARNPAPGTSGQGQGPSTSSRGTQPSNAGSPNSSNRAGKPAPGKPASGRPAQAGRGGKPAAAGAPAQLPPGAEGGGDGQSWYQRSVRETTGETSRPQTTPYPIGPTPARMGAVAQIYEYVTTRTPPPDNIASEALRAYYPRANARTVKSWACQVLCMISEYHMACVTRGSPVTSPILPEELHEQLPPPSRYPRPEDRSGHTDVRVRDNWAKTLRVAVWLHRLDMAVSGEPSASETMVPSRHHLGPLLGYFLAPHVAWNLCFEDVLLQVLEENRKQNERRHQEAMSSLNKCHSRRTRLHAEMDTVSAALGATSLTEAHQELEKKLEAIRTSLRSVEASISRFENIIKECRMMEDEVRQTSEELASRDQPNSGSEDVEMVDQEMVSQLEPSVLSMEANTEDQPVSASGGGIVSPEEEAILMGVASQSEGHSQASETASVSGELADLQLTSPPRPEAEEEETHP